MYTKLTFVLIAVLILVPNLGGMVDNPTKAREPNPHFWRLPECPNITKYLYGDGQFFGVTLHNSGPILTLSKTVVYWVPKDGAFLDAEWYGFLEAPAMIYQGDSYSSPTTVILKSREHYLDQYDDDWTIVFSTNVSAFGNVSGYLDYGWCKISVNW